MCLVELSSLAEDEIDQLQAQADAVKRIIWDWANQANPEQRGMLDRLNGTLKHIQNPQLKGTRHYKVKGRHRVYVQGSHKVCTYKAFCFRRFKKDDVMPDGSPEFQRRLLKGLSSDMRILLPPER